MHMKPTPQKQKDKKVAVLGLGGYGGQIVHYIAEKGDDYNLLYMDSDERDIMESTVKAIKNTIKGTTGFVSLIKELKDYQKVIITAGLGGEFGTFSSYIIYNMAKSRNFRDIELFLTMPATFEGRRRKNRAQDMLDTLNSSNIEYTLIELDNIIKDMDDRTLICDCFKNIDEVIYQRIKEKYKLWFYIDVNWSHVI